MKKIAQNGLLIILSLIIVFHLLIIAGLIPFEIVWGGRLKNKAEMIRFEAISILTNLFMVFTVAIYAGLLKIAIKPVLTKIVLWLMFVLFLLNTLGNLFSQNEMEKLIFTPLTLLLSLFSLRLATSKSE